MPVGSSFNCEHTASLDKTYVALAMALLLNEDGYINVEWLLLP